MRIPDMAAMWLGWTEMPPTSILSFVINSSRFFTCFLSLARRFWNQIFTWEVVKYLIKRGDRVGKNDFFQHMHLNILSYIWQLSRIIYFIYLYFIYCVLYSPAVLTSWGPVRARPSSWWWCSGCSGTPSPAPAAGGRCTPRDTCPSSACDLRATLLK